MTINEKLDKILEHVSKQEVHNKHFEKKLEEANVVMDQYKSDRAGILGATFTLSAVVSFFTTLFNK